MSIAAGTGNATFSGLVTANANPLTVTSANAVNVTTGITGAGSAVDFTATTVSAAGGINVGAGSVTITSDTMSFPGGITANGGITLQPSADAVTIALGVDDDAVLVEY